MEEQHTKLRILAKAILRGKSIVINADITKKERSQINNVILCLKELEKKEQNKAKFCRKK